MNCGWCRLQISSLWLLKCCVLWPQWTMAHQVTNSLSVTSQMLWCKATTNCIGPRPGKWAPKLPTIIMFLSRLWKARCLKCSDCVALWVLNCRGLQAQWTVVAVGWKYPLCDYSNVVSFGHNELWLLQPQIASLWPLKCCGVRPQRTVAPQDHKNGH